MRTTRTAPARPVLIATLALTTAGALLLTPHTAGAEPAPPVTRDEAPLDQRAAQAPASAAKRALADEQAAGGAVRGYPREQTLSPDHSGHAANASAYIAFRPGIFR